MTSVLKVDNIQNSSGTSAISIDSSGNVTLTNPVAFEAKLSANITGFDTTAFGDNVAFDQTNYNLGGHFKTSGTDIGLFVVPFDGIYSFDGWIYSSVDQFSQMWLTLNGARKALSDVRSDATTSYLLGGTWNVKLDANDKVGLHPYNAGTSEQINTNDSHTYFRGNLVHRL